jgi:hypothetical protein
LARQDDQREDAQDGAKRDLQATDRGDDNAERQVAPAGHVSPGQEQAYRQPPGEEHSENANRDKYESDRVRSRLAIVTGQFSQSDHGAQHDVKDRETSEEGEKPTGDIVENRQKPQMFLIPLGGNCAA